MESKETADSELLDIAHYIAADADFNKAAYENSRLALFDFLGCGFEALDEKSCRQAIEPIVPEARVVGGARVPALSMNLILPPQPLRLARWVVG